MRMTIRWAALALLISLFAIVSASAQKADDKPPAPSTSPPANKDAKKYNEVAQLPGKLVKLNPSSQEAVLEYHSGLGRYAKTQHMDLTFADDMKVWLTKPPEKIDENGNAKKMSPAELEKIKGHTRETKGLYQGEMADLHEGQMVKVVLGKPKDAPKKPAPREKGAAPEKEFIYVTQIVITVDEQAPTKTDKKKP